MVDEEKKGLIEVAPLAGAWIEISVPKWLHRLGYVAPLAGAWIEIVLKLIV